MDIYAFLEVAAIVLGIVAALGSIAYCSAIWFFSSVTYIEPIVIETKQREKDINSKINEYHNCIAYSVKLKKGNIFDISKEYQNAKVGQVLSARK